ncbi:hypothetical protein ACICHK_34625 [Streptomyces sp. AHU1]|uniref:hypothetical protein n=1 Tax=Streptomyces sp. AHU1 TaxID=3377215 RepID=UPI00387799DF
MIGEYLRVTAAELDRATQDPDRASDLVEEVRDAIGCSHGSPHDPARVRRGQGARGPR